MPEYTASTNGLGTIRILKRCGKPAAGPDSIRLLPVNCLVQLSRLKNEHGFQPQSPQPLPNFIKLLGYPDGYHMYAWTKADPKGQTFVTRKITRAIAMISAGVFTRKPGIPSRLGVCTGVRRSDVADAAAGKGGKILFLARANLTRSVSFWMRRLVMLA